MNRHTTVSLALAALSASVFAQEMPAPSYAVGDRWAYRETDLLTKNETGRWTETVTAANATEYWIDSRRVQRTTWRGDSVKGLHREQFLFDEAAPEQRGKTIATNDAGCAYPWPLKVGMKFACTERYLWPNGWNVRYELKYTVEAAESVETPAGRFDTLRLEAKGFATNETNNNNVSGHERVIWLAPAAKREVRHEIRTRLRNGQLFRVEGRELMEFSPGKS
jgi:hypothetical protein